MNDWSLRTQILSAMALVVAIAVTILTLVTVTEIRSDLNESLKQNALSVAALLAENVGPGLDFGDSVYVADIVKGAFVNNEVLAAVIFDQKKELVFRRIDDPRLHFLSSCRHRDNAIVDPTGDSYVLTRPIMVRDHVAGCLHLAVSREAVDNRIRSSVTTILTSAVLVVGLVILLGLTFTRIVLRPIRVFEEAAALVTAGEGSSTLELENLQIDFRPLGAAFNDMQSRLRQAFEQIRKSRDQLEQLVTERTQALRDELTERKRVEDELRLSKQRLQMHVQQTPLGVIEWDLDFRVTLWNRAAEGIFGYSETEAMSKHPTEIILPEEVKPVVDQIWQELIANKGGNQSTNDNLHKDGRTLTCDWYNTPLVNDDGVVIGVASLIQDCTDKLEAERQRAELQEKLDRAERMESLGVLAGGVAHDLNNMLGPVVGYSEMILMQMKGESPLKTRVERIFRSAQDAADVIQDLLTLARRGRYEMVATDLNCVIENYLVSPSCEQLRERRPEVEMVTKLDQSVGMIKGSAPHLSKVIMNFVVNAYDAMPFGGKICIETSQMRLDRLLGGHDAIESAEYVVLKVRDTGSGIEPEDLERVFEPYFSKKKMGTSGSGLGLSVVYGVVKDHNGYYDIFSEVGQGTEFVLYFPVVKVEQKHDTKKETVIIGTESVLVVDDVAEQREMASDVIGSLGYRVKTAIHGHDALDYLNVHQSDLIVLDMIMENGFDGLDTYREILKLHPAQKAIIVSGFSATARVNETLNLGAAAYVKKPYTRQVIGQALREALDQVRVASIPSG